jgi:hypothetical protein
MVAASAAGQQPDQSRPAVRAPVPDDVRQPAAAAAAQPPEEFGDVSITHRSFRQIFEPYLYPRGPVFVTGDAVLQAFDELLAQSLGRFERAGTAHLLQALRLMHRQVAATEPGSTETGESPAGGNPSGQSGASQAEDTGYRLLRQRARTRAAIVVSVALRLIGEEDAPFDPDIAAIVETEVRRVEQAQGVYSRNWFAATDEPDSGFDYSGFQPHGYYLRSEALKRYFRTVRWLQSIPFRPSSDEELLALFLLSKALTSSKPADSDDRQAAENYLRCRRDLFGSRDDPDLLFAARMLKDRPADLDSVRQHLQAVSGGPVEMIEHSIPDPDRFALYIIFPSRLPDEEFFRRRRTAEGFTYTEPSGLEICALLGSDYARRQLELRLPDAYRQSLQVEIDRFSAEKTDNSLYSQYLKTMAALLDPPEPDAPAFTREQAWQAKSCNAALAGWVGMRKRLPVTRRPPSEAVEEFFAEVPAGFVEPDPEFFDRLGQLSERVLQLLDRCGALPPPAAEFAAWLRTFEQLLAADRIAEGADDVNALTPSEREVVEKALTILGTLKGLRIDPATAARQKEEIRAAAADAADAIVRGVFDQDPTYQALVIELATDLKRRWQQLGTLCRRLEVMAHKQLRGVAFNEAETYFLSDFGFALAAVMLYGGDSYRRPRDDAPVTFTYFFDPRSKKHLHAAVARPREILVPYPMGGRQVLCRGAVLPFYEFIAAKDFTDEQWRDRLDSDERPSALRWLDPVMPAGDPQKSWRRAETPLPQALPRMP